MGLQSIGHDWATSTLNTINDYNEIIFQKKNSVELLKLYNFCIGDSSMKY